MIWMLKPSLRGSFSSILTLLYLLLVWLWATQTGVKGLVSCQDHRSWSSGGYDLLQAMFLIMSNLIPLNRNPSEHAVATVEGPSAICYTRHTCLAIFSGWRALYFGSAGTEHWYLINIFKLVLCKIKKTKTTTKTLGSRHSSRHSQIKRARIAKYAVQLLRKLFTHLMVCPLRPIRSVQL